MRFGHAIGEQFGELRRDERDVFAWRFGAIVGIHGRNEQIGREE